jgi:hypothetical protein
MVLENQFIYPVSKGSKLILAAPSSPAKLGSVLRSPPAGGLGKRRKSKENYTDFFLHGFYKIKLTN